MIELSQKDTVFKHLKSKSLTAVQAVEFYGIYRLSAIIFRLREEGHTIITVNQTTVKRNGRASNWAEYFLTKQAPNPQGELLKEQTT